MKNRIVMICMAASALALAFALSGCSQEVSKTTSSSVSSDGTVKSQEKTVTKAPDGTVTKKQESTTTAPNISTVAHPGGGEVRDVRESGSVG